jgi:hypothetical protein
MQRRLYRSFLIVVLISLALGSTGRAQDATPGGVRPALPDIVQEPEPARETAIDVSLVNANPRNGWAGAEQQTPTKSKRYVVTKDEPARKQVCRVQAITNDELICSRAHGGSRAYKREQIVALIIPGTKGESLAMFLGANARLGASIWGTIALVATCPVCAAGTALAAFIFFGMAGVSVIADDANDPEKTLYLAPGQVLSNNFRSVER